mmetsp:Transcript_16349/g.40178  ORF Transcript_16349/g.40178 Transcript_16349/m.40178 type:complete len:200 (+) Transcript_16349:2496-3095(+)
MEDASRPMPISPGARGSKWGSNVNGSGVGFWSSLTVPRVSVVLRLREDAPPSERFSSTSINELKSVPIGSEGHSVLHRTYLDISTCVAATSSAATVILLAAATRGTAAVSFSSSSLGVKDQHALTSASRSIRNSASSIPPSMVTSPSHTALATKTSALPVLTSAPPSMSSLARSRPSAFFVHTATAVHASEGERLLPTC